MSRVEYALPCDPDVLRALVTAEECRCDVDSERTLAWLGEHRTAADAIEAIRAAWSRSSLPLRKWATRIEGIAAWVEPREGLVGIQLAVGGSSPAVVSQMAPIGEDELIELTKTLRGPLPACLLDLLRTAPRLSFDHASRLISAVSLVAPMAYVQSWLDGREITPEVCAAEGYVYPKLDDYITEFAYDGTGNCMALGLDGGIHFYDYAERPDLVPCGVSVEELVRLYFEDADSIRDSVTLRLPTSQAKEARPLYPAEKITAYCTKLSAWANLALAVRCCERASPLHHLAVLPPAWIEHARQLHGFLEVCRQAAISGNPFAEGEAERMANTAEAARCSWYDARPDPTDVRYLGGRFSRAITRLATACAAPEDTDSAHAVAASCGLLTIWSGVDSAAWHETVLADAQKLLDLNLGQPGTAGKPVPESFFAEA